MKKLKVETIASGRYEHVKNRKNDVNNNISSNIINICTTTSNNSDIKGKVKAGNKQYITSPSILMILLIAYSK